MRLHNAGTYELNMNFNIKSLYKEFGEEILTLHKFLNKSLIPIDNRCTSLLDYEMLYVLVRTLQPKFICEFSPFAGWTTSALLYALEQYKDGEIHSFDLKDKCSKNLISLYDGFCDNNWKFHSGDVRNSFDFIISNADFILIDCDHSYEFALDYIDMVFKPLLNRNKPTWFWIHDIVYHKLEKKCEGKSERRAVLKFLEDNDIEFYTNTKKTKYIKDGFKYINKRGEIVSLRKKLNIKDKLRVGVKQEESAVVFKLGN